MTGGNLILNTQLISGWVYRIKSIMYKDEMISGLSYRVKVGFLRITFCIIFYELLYNCGNGLNIHTNKDGRIIVVSNFIVWV